jgi:hypothetical protein
MDLDERRGTDEQLHEPIDLDILDSSLHEDDPGNWGLGAQSHRADTLVVTQPANNRDPIPDEQTRAAAKADTPEPVPQRAGVANTDISKVLQFLSGRACV